MQLCPTETVIKTGYMFYGYNTLPYNARMIHDVISLAQDTALARSMLALIQ